MNRNRIARVCSILLLAAGLGLGGCAHMVQGGLKTVGLQSIDQANTRIADLQATEQAQLDALRAAMDNQRYDLESLTQQRLQEASNHDFLAAITYQLDPSPSSYESLMYTEVQSAETTLVAPDPATVATGVAKMKSILADKDHAIQLEAAEVAAAQAKAAQIAGQEKAVQAQVAAEKAQVVQTQQAATQQVAQIQRQKDTVVAQVLEKQQELLNDKAFTDAVKLRLTLGAAGLAVLAILAAIFSPLLKRQLIEFAAVMGVLAVTIPYVTPLIVECILGAGLILVLVSIFLEHKSVVAKVTAPSTVPAARTGATSATTTAPAAPAVATVVPVVVSGAALTATERA